MSIFSGAFAVNCYSISQGGGGSLGSYEAGVFYGLVNNLPAAEVAYDVVVGISVGSLNSDSIAQFAKGSEIAASNFLVNTYLTLNGSKSIYEDWAGGLVDGLLFHSGLYSTAPLRNLLKSKTLGSIFRKLSLGTTNIATGLFERYNETLSIDDIIEATMCSSAIPITFEDQKFNGGVYNDGGIYTVIDAESAVERCLEVTDVEEEIYVDILSCYRHVLDPENKLKTLDVLYRTYEVGSYTKSIKSIQDAMVAYPGANFRYYIQPSIVIPGSGGLNFTQEFLQDCVNLGISDAKNAIKNTTDVREKFKNWSEYDNIIYP